MTDTLTNVSDHPAKWSASVLTELADMVGNEAEYQDRRLRVLDPFAGVGRERLADALGVATVFDVVGVELQPEWADSMTVQGDATDLPHEWGNRFDVVVTSPCYGNRLADHHEAKDPCKACGGRGVIILEGRDCPTCKGTKLSWRNTYAHALRRQGGDLVHGSAAGMQWGRAYRELHKEAITEMLRCTVEGGLLLVNMSNHVRDGVEQLVVEWWVNELLVRGCGLVEVRRVRTPRQGFGANGDTRVDGEVVIGARTPAERRLL